MSDKRKDYISWDEYFMGVAILASMRSKDLNTQVEPALSARIIRSCPWVTTGSRSAAQMMNFHGAEKQKVWTVSICILPILN